MVKGVKERGRLQTVATGRMSRRRGREDGRCIVRNVNDTQSEMQMQMLCIKCIHHSLTHLNSGFPFNQRNATEAMTVRSLPPRCLALFFPFFSLPNSAHSLATFCSCPQHPGSLHHENLTLLTKPSTFPFVSLAFHNSYAPLQPKCSEKEYATFRCKRVVVGGRMSWTWKSIDVSRLRLCVMMA